MTDAFMSWSGVWGGLALAAGLLCVLLALLAEEVRMAVAGAALLAIATLLLVDWDERKTSQFVTSCLTETVLNETECRTLKGAMQGVLAIVSTRLGSQK